MAKARRRPTPAPIPHHQLVSQIRLMEPGVRAASLRHQEAMARLKAIEAEVEAMRPDLAEARKEFYASMQANNEAGSTWIQLVRQLPEDEQNAAFDHIDKEDDADGQSEPASA